MEIKATLNKPYKEEQRLDFIVQQNHTNGYEIRETEQALEAWGYTQEEIEQQNKVKEIEKLKEKMEIIDKKRIRAMCENEMKDEEITWLEYYNSLIKELRQQISNLSK